MNEQSEPLINITRRHALFFAGFLVLYEFLTYIANDMIMPGMLYVIKTFQASTSMVAYSLMLYVLGGSSLQIILGPLSDRYGRRIVMLTGAILFVIFTIFLACSVSMQQFLWGRFFEGMGLCFISVVGYAVLQEIFAELDAVRLIAIMGNVAILAPLFGPLLGALLLQHMHWRWIFVIIASAGVLALWGLWRYMPESVGALRRDGKRIHAAPLSLRHAIVNYKRVLSNIPFIWGVLAYGLLGIPCIAWIALSPIFIVTNAHLSLLTYAYWQIPVFTAFIVGNFALTYLTRYLTLVQLMRCGAIIVFFSLFLMFACSFWYQKSFLTLLPGLILYCFGYSLVATPLNRWILFLNTISKGTVSAVICLTSLGMQSLGIAVINAYDPQHSHVIYAEYCICIGILFIICIQLGLNASSSGQKQVVQPSDH